MNPKKLRNDVIEVNFKALLYHSFYIIFSLFCFALLSTIGEYAPLVFIPINLLFYFLVGTSLFSERYAEKPGYIYLLYISVPALGLLLIFLYTCVIPSYNSNSVDTFINIYYAPWQIILKAVNHGYSYCLYTIITFVTYGLMLIGASVKKKYIADKEKHSLITRIFDFICVFDRKTLFVIIRTNLFVFFVHIFLIIALLLVDAIFTQMMGMIGFLPGIAVTIYFYSTLGYITYNNKISNSLIETISFYNPFLRHKDEVGNWSITTVLFSYLSITIIGLSLYLYYYLPFPGADYENFDEGSIIFFAPFFSFFRIFDYSKSHYYPTPGYFLIIGSLIPYLLMLTGAFIKKNGTEQMKMKLKRLILFRKLK